MPSPEPPEVDTDTRGVLRPAPGLQRFALERTAPPAGLRPFVQWFWTVTWDLPPDEPFVQEIVPKPAVNLSMRDGVALINGPVRGRSQRTIDGQGQVVAALFTPAGFRPFVGGHQGRFTDRIVPAATELGASVEAWHDADAAAAADREARVDALAAMLEARAPVLEPEGRLVNEATALVADDVTITRVARLAAEVGVGVRHLQRLFAAHAGVTPKQVIQQHRLQEAAERVARGEAVRWTDVSYELGFADQAHFTRAFTATIGVPPERYARECQAAGESRSPA